MNSKGETEIYIKLLHYYLNLSDIIDSQEYMVVSELILNKIKQNRLLYH